ncbi:MULTISPECIES: hypothetical protein [Thalassospira]|uniref:hypothetical protein n=1 Tax=Thalassospira TaxID=168934 RepID=UPI00241E2A91|nr:MULTISPECIES: hypothetical protein [Thalassospira]
MSDEYLTRNFSKYRASVNPMPTVIIQFPKDADFSTISEALNGIRTFAEVADANISWPSRTDASNRITLPLSNAQAGILVSVGIDTLEGARVRWPFGKPKP